MAPRNTIENETAIIESYYRFRTCPACGCDRMVFVVNADAVRCPDSECGFILSGVADRQGAAEILAAVAAHKERMSPGSGPSTVRGRLEAIERRLDRLERHVARDDEE